MAFTEFDMFTHAPPGFDNLRGRKVDSELSLSTITKGIIYHVFSRSRKLFTPAHGTEHRRRKKKTEKGKKEMSEVAENTIADIR